MRWLIFLAALLVGPGEARAAGRFDVRIVSRVGTGVADETPKHARADVGVTLYAVLLVDGVVYSDAPRLSLAGKLVKPRPLADAGRVDLEWSKIEPSAEDLSNTQSGAFRYEAIPYTETRVDAWSGKASVLADVHPTLTPDRGLGLGTMRYRLRAVRGEIERATPGTSARRKKSAGGLTDAVHRVSLRADDSYLGWLTEMYGQPYIWASAGPNDRAHQSELLEGSDCADFVVYGWRRLGHDVAYTWTGGLPKVTRLVARGEPREDGVYVDARGKALAFPAPGELLLFPRHVGVVVRDAGVIGVLDEADIMFHTLFASPREQPIADSGYGGRVVEVRRWKQ